MRRAKGRILRNAAKCLACGVTVESKHRHDYQTCGCPNDVMVDGGFTYLRGGAVNPSLVENLCIVEEAGPVPDEGNDEFTTALFGGVEK